VGLFGSRQEALVSDALLTPGMMTPLSELADGSDGALTWLPSTPVRKLVFGSPPLLHPVGTTRPVLGSVAPLPGALQTERSPKPMPRAGVRTIPTPLMRSKTRAQPARITLFLFPVKVPRKPSANKGFQASATRGPKFE